MEANAELSPALPGREPVTPTAVVERPARRPRTERLPPDPAANPAAISLTRLGPGARKTQASCAPGGGAAAGGAPQRHHHRPLIPPRPTVNATLGPYQ